MSQASNELGWPRVILEVIPYEMKLFLQRYPHTKLYLTNQIQNTIRLTDKFITEKYCEILFSSALCKCQISSKAEAGGKQVSLHDVVP